MLLFSFFGKTHRTGDGNEYYSMQLAIAETGRPYASEVVWEASETHHQKHPSEPVLDAEYYKTTFPDLRVDETMDFPHFWFYSLIPGILLKLLGVINISQTGAFLLFHVMLSWFTAWYLYRHYGLAGLLAFFVIWLTSPILWYTNKVHTEYFTFCLGLVAIAALFRSQFLTSAFMLACISTQNPLFGVAACAAVGMHFLTHLSQPLLFRHLLGLVTIGGILALHPFYYFLRLGVVTPQLATGAASTESSLQRGLIAVWDPNLGLLPSWPLAFLLIGLGGYLLFRQRRRALFYWPALLVILAWIAQSLYSHGATAHQAHGAVAAVSRYATWYIPLFLPFLVLIFKHWRYVPLRKTFALVSGGLAVFTIAQAYPSRTVQTFEPSFSGRLFESVLGDLYYPYPEVFVRRYFGKIQIHEHKAFLHRDSGLVLLVPNGRSEHILMDDLSRFGPNHFATLMAEVPTSRTAGLYSTRYGKLSKEAVKRVMTLGDSSILKVFHFGGNDPDIEFVNGWYKGEQTHRWSSKEATARITGIPSRADSVILEINAPVPMTFDLNIAGALSGALTDHSITPDYKGSITLPLTPAATGTGQIELTISAESSWQPKELFNNSSDDRVMGLSFGKVSFINSDADENAHH